MKIFTYTLRGIITLTALCLCAQGTFAYAPQTTHAGLTQEILSFYQTETGEAFSSETTELVIHGAIDEDSPDTRCLNHFYDPVHGIGFNGNRTSLDWATSELSGNEFIWKNGIDAYANGDEHTAMLVLGHILHLVEDASVPDHTRNDPHKGDGLAGLYTGESPFEYWTNIHKDRDSLRGLGGKLSSEGVEMHYCSTLTNCFNFIAQYSNGNFFSRDTIGSPEYESPEVISKDTHYAYGIDEITEKSEKLYQLIERKDGGYDSKLVHEKDYSIISEYFDRLAPQAVGVGARVVDLYMTEAKFARAERLRKEAEERERVEGEQLALHERMKGAGIFQQFAFGFTDLFFHTPATFASNMGTKIAVAGDGLGRGYTTVFGNAVHGGTMVVTSVERGGLAVGGKAQEVAVASIAIVSTKTTNAISGTANNLTALISQLLEARKVLEAMAMTSPTPTTPTQENLGEVAGASTTAALALLPISGSGIVSPPEPRIDYGFPQGSVPFVSSPTAEPTPTTSPEVMPTTDIIAPPPPTVLNFQGVPFIQGEALNSATTSIALDGSAEASSTVTLLAVEDATTTAYFFDVGQDALWNFNVQLAEGTSTLLLTSTDEAGNVSSSTALTISTQFPILPPPPPPADPIAPLIRISEVAWAGTFASGADEWIEIHNRTDDTLSLDGLTLRTADGGLVIPLSGDIAPQQYYVISSSADVFIDPMSLWIPNMIASFGDGLADSGEELQLVNSADNTVVDTIPYCLDWCEKGSVVGSTMMLEYFEDPAFNWDYWSSGFQYSDIRDRNNDFIRGLPGVGTENLVPV